MCHKDNNYVSPCTERVTFGNSLHIQVNLPELQMKGAKNYLNMLPLFQSDAFLLHLPFLCLYCEVQLFFLQVDVL